MSRLANALYEEARSLDASLAAAEYGLGRVAAENRRFRAGRAAFQQGSGPSIYERRSSTTIWARPTVSSGR